MLLITVAAYAVKGITGLGSALVFVTLSATFLDPHLVIPLSALLDVVGGSAMLLRRRGSRSVMRRTAWLALCLGLVAGGLAGATLLRIFPTNVLKVALGAVLIVVILFSLLRTKSARGTANRQLDVGTAVGASLVAGVAGGAVGVDGPPLALILRRRLGGDDLRSTITAVLLLSDAIRVPIYAVMFLITTRVLMLFALCFPAVLAGVIAGEWAFGRTSLPAFSWMINGLVLAAAVELVATGLGA